MLLAQAMWLWMSRSTYIAVFELVIGRRGWHKTPHGHAEQDEDAVAPGPGRAYGSTFAGDLPTPAGFAGIGQERAW
jgi:hypothetical protein